MQDLERKLMITRWWTADMQEWVDTGDLVARQRYQRCLDALEGLVVARLFKLTKMNMSQTGEPPGLSLLTVEY